MATVPSDLVARITALEQLRQTAEAVLWAQEQLPALVSDPERALQLVVDQARGLTGAPVVWALRWAGDPTRGVSFRGLAQAGGLDGMPAPDQVSASVVGQVVRDKKPAWSDDAASDARFLAAQSVVRWKIRSVGCLPLGTSAVLYLADPARPGCFDAEIRARLGALCRLAAPFLDREPARQARRAAIPVHGMVGQSPAMAELFEAIRAFAPMPWPVLILGETGVGKEQVAHALHGLSPLAGRPFVPVNCGAIPEPLAESVLFGHERGAFTGADRPSVGVVERAEGGTLFLDEVGELAPAVQVKLLRLLQEGTWERVGGQRAMRFTGRVIAATHRRLDPPDETVRFRDDLYYRLAACILQVPALRDRPGDVEILAHHLLERALAELPGPPRLALPDRTTVALARRSWPGNVRDLQNALRFGVARALADRSPALEPRHLPPERGAAGDPAEIAGDLEQATEAFQRERVTRTLAGADGNRSEAARRLGVSRQWLHRLLARWDVA